MSHITYEKAKEVGTWLRSLLREEVHKMIVLAPDGTVDKWEPGYQEVSSFETKFKEYLEMKNRNVKTEDILKELEQPERVLGRSR